MTQKKLTTQTPKHLQYFFVLVLLVAAIVETILWMYRVAEQYPHNPNLSAFYMIFIMTTVLPLVMTSTAYALVRRKIPVLQRIFEAIVVTIVALVLLGLINTGLTNILTSLGLYTSAWEMLGSFNFAILSTLIVFATMTIYLLIARRKGQW